MENTNDKEIICIIQRRLLTCFLDLVVLSRLEERPMSGYDVITLVQNRFGMLLSAGTTYSALYRLERQRLVSAQWRKHERVYTSTEKGKHIIRVVTKEIDKLQNLLGQLVRR